jgi:predicted nucleic acid-binding Zn ribbon protein
MNAAESTANDCATQATVKFVPDFAYECPSCGAEHDGMDTGTEECRDCHEDYEDKE